MVFRRNRRGNQARTPQAVWADWMDANEAGDAKRAGDAASETTLVAPDSFHAWFEAGLYAKARRDWALSFDRNRRALELFGESEADEFDGQNPAAWNLGIAATALGDWTTARRAWAAFGITGMDASTGPIVADYGQAPIRLNPDRPSFSHEIVPNFGETEVV